MVYKKNLFLLFLTQRMWKRGDEGEREEGERETRG